MQSISLTIQGRVVLLTRDEIRSLGEQFHEISARACKVRDSWEQVPEVAAKKLLNPVTGRLVSALDNAGDSLVALAADMDPILSDRATTKCSGE